ncbi:MAG TPA: PASTA domain-containing protein [Pedococcus sp.]|nr:PASTA domain-containing protein [Pedococcus sp.]
MTTSRGRWTRRARALVAVLAVAVVCGLPTVAHGSPRASTAGRLSLQPRAGPAGASVTARATGFDGCPPVGSDDASPGQVAFYWDGTDLLDQVDVTGPDGSAETTFVVPVGATLEAHLVVATCVGADRVTARARFTVEPSRQTPATVPNLLGMTEQEATAAIEEAQLVLGRTTGGGGRVTNQTADGGVEVAPGTPVDIELGEAPPRTVVVPDLFGATVAQSRDRLDAAGLVLGSVAAAGEVVADQSPDAGSLVLPGTRVDVTLGPVVPPTVVVPDLLGRSAEEASTLLHARGLVLGLLTGSGAAVTEQVPRAGASVKAGSAVNVSLNAEPPPRLVPVPDLRGRSTSQARSDLEGIGLVLGGRADGVGEVVGQQPAAGVLVPPGSTVSVTYGTALPWWLVAAVPTAILLFLALPGMHLYRRHRERRWVRDHVRVVPRRTDGVHITESGRTELPAVVLRIEPHADPGSQVLEEV